MSVTYDWLIKHFQSSTLLIINYKLFQRVHYLPCITYIYKMCISICISMIDTVNMILLQSLINRHYPGLDMASMIWKRDTQVMCNLRLTTCMQCAWLDSLEPDFGCAAARESDKYYCSLHMSRESRDCRVQHIWPENRGQLNHWWNITKYITSDNLAA